MDFNYDICTWDFSLRTATLTKITQNVAEAAIRNRRTSDNRKIVQIAKEIAENLDLLPVMITEIKKLIQPILEEMQEWYQTKGYHVCPILTPHGTVDVVKSVRALIQSSDTDLSARSKFEKACDYCLEEEICHYGKLLSEADRLSYESEYHQSWTMQGFWYGIYEGNFSRMLTLNDLSPANLAAGMDRAMTRKSNLVMKYFLKKASQEIVRRIVDEWNFVIFNKTNLSPDTFVTLFRIDQRDCFEGMFSYAVLKALLKWPYQHLFLKAAKTLVLKLSLTQFLDIAWMIISKPYGYEEYNCKGLFVNFWKMRKDYVGAYVDRECVRQLLWYVFQMRDTHIAFMVFDDISKRNKEEYLLEFNYYSAILINMKDFKTLQFIVDMCKEKDEPLYVKFKSIVEYETSECFHRNLSGKVWFHALKRLLSEL